jgi:hypothetical protein
MSAEILTPESSRWDDFIDNLDSAAGEDCDGSRRWTERILAEMRDINVPATLLIFDALHGGCDCGVLNNVEPGWLERRTLLLERIQRVNA